MSLFVVALCVRLLSCCVCLFPFLVVHSVWFVVVTYMRSLFVVKLVSIVVISVCVLLLSCVVCLLSRRSVSRLPFRLLRCCLLGVVVSLSFLVCVFVLCLVRCVLRVVVLVCFDLVR